MNFQFDQVLPVPLSSMSHTENSVWNSSIILEKGKKIVVEAQSGRGKSTFIHLLFGIRKDYKGSIFFNQKKLSEFSKKDWVNYRKEQVSIVFQDLQLFPNITVLENLELKNNLTNHFTKDQLIEMLNSVGLSDKLHVPCGLLSMGQQQRVAIIRALSQPFSWLLLDEPFSHLDEINTGICMELINKQCFLQNAGWIITSLGTDLTSSYDQLISI